MKREEMNPSEQKMLEVARELAQRAALEVKSRLPTASVQSRKPDDSPVTEADLASDRLIREGLQFAFPDHGILTEETGLIGPKDFPWTWCIDPLDGTKAFAKKIPGFCVMVALLRVGRPHLGVVVDPVEDRTYEAVRGHGAFQIFGGRRERLRVSARRDFSEMPLVISTGFPEAALERIRKICPGPLVPPINSVGIKVGLLARQVGDVYINHHPVSYWDTAAPSLILEEAGGAFTRLDGRPLEYDLRAPFSHGSKTLASNGLRHEDFVSALAGVFS